MKGFVFGILGLFWILCIVILFFSAEVGLRLGGGKGYELPMSIDAYSMQNALDASETYMDAAASYSIYQACYDNLRQAGWRELAKAPYTEKVVIGGKSYGPIRTIEEFNDDLAATILDHINTYSSYGYEFFETYKVDMPEYNDVTVTGSSDSIEIQANSPDKLKICKPESCKLEEEAKNGDSDNMNVPDNIPGLNEQEVKPNFRELVILEKPSDISKTIQTPCYGLYEQAIQQSKELEDAINELLKMELDRLSVNGEPGSAGGDCNYVVSASNEEIENMLKTGIASVSDAEYVTRMQEVLDRIVDYDIEVVDVELEFTLISFMSIPNSQQGICLLEDGRVSAVVKSSVEGPAEEKFPVDNGAEVAYEPLAVHFIVKAGYDTTEYDT